MAEENYDCCIAGGGPAGMMLGFLLARAGIKVIVLEKHKDFFRDFRGDTIHPSTTQLMYELGIMDEFLKVPHQEMEAINAMFNGQLINIVDFKHLPVAKKMLGIMPQWDFLNFVNKQAGQYPTFKLLVNTNVTGLLNDGTKIIGVVAETPNGQMQIRAKLTVGTDGRSSTVCKEAKLNVIDTGAPIDVLWFRISHQDIDPKQVLGRFQNGNIMIMLDRNDYWQCAYVVEKNGFEDIQKKGLENFRARVLDIAPFLNNRLQEIKSWDDIKLLSVKIDHLEKWYTNGLLCIGDAAHAMSPIGGVGINLAVQDAVAAANILYPHLKRGNVDVNVLKQVQKRREWPTRVIQFIQVVLQKGISTRRANPSDTSLPFFLKMLQVFPLLRRIPARIIGLGIRPEHIRTPDAFKS